MSKPVFYSKKLIVPRGTSEPYITGDTFRFHADWIFDETNILLDPAQVKKGDKIFVQGKYIPIFFACIHGKIKEPYVLMSHNSDQNFPGPHASFLDDQKMVAWFTRNIDRSHPKLHPLPVGIANRYWSHGDLSIWEEKKNCKKVRKNLLLMNFDVATCPQERKTVHQLFKNKAFCMSQIQHSFADYLDDLLSSKFVLSPRGNGLDCFRTWESLYMGAYPIVRSSSLNPLYEDLPVVIVEDWKEVTESFLHRKYTLFQKKQCNFEKLRFDYWQKQINSIRI